MPPPIAPAPVMPGDQPTNQGPPPSFDYGNEPAPPKGFMAKMKDPETMQMAGLLGEIGGNIGSMFDAPGAPQAPKVFGLDEAKAHIDQLAKIEDRRKKNKLEEQKLAIEARKMDDQLAEQGLNWKVHYGPNGLGVAPTANEDETQQRFKQSPKGRHEEEMRKAILMARQGGIDSVRPPQIGGQQQTPLPPSMGRFGGLQVPQQDGAGAPPSQAGGPPNIPSVRDILSQNPNLRVEDAQQIVQQIQQQQQFQTEQEQAKSKMELEAAQAKKASEQVDIQNKRVELETKALEQSLDVKSDTNLAAAIKEYRESTTPKFNTMTGEASLPDPQAIKAARWNVMRILEKRAESDPSSKESLIDMLEEEAKEAVQNKDEVHAARILEKLKKWGAIK